MRSLFYVIFFLIYLPAAFAESFTLKPFNLGNGVYSSLALDNQANVLFAWNEDNTLLSKNFLANGTFTEPTTLSETIELISSSMSVDGLGNATLLFVDGSGNLKAARLAAGAKAWQIFPYPLGKVDHLLETPLYIGSSNAGDTIATWVYEGKLQTARADALGNWIRIQDLPVSASGHNYVQVTMGKNGLAAVVWEDEKFHVYSATLQPYATAWSKPMCITAKAYSGFQKVAIGPDNTVLVVWKTMGHDAGLNGAVKAAILSPGSNKWQGIDSPGPAVWGEAIDLTVNANGDFLALWTNSSDPNGIHTFLKTAWLLKHSKKWTKSEKIASMDFISRVSISLDDNGNAVATWEPLMGLYTAVQSAGRGFSSIHELSKRGNSLTKPLILPSGQVVFTWTEYNRTTQRFDLQGAIATQL